MIILGMDPGSRITGYGVVKKDGNRNVHLENGSLYCKDLDSFAQRLVYLFEEIQKVIKKYRPEVMAIERIFYHKNPQSLQKLGEARGVIVLSGAIAGLPVFEYTALQVKQAVTGYGAATKHQMQQMVRKLLNLTDVAEENASDALGVAICHANSLSHLTASKQPKRVRVGKTQLNSAQEILKKASFYR